MKGETQCDAKSWYWAIKNKQVFAFPSVLSIFMISLLSANCDFSHYSEDDCIENWIEQVEISPLYDSYVGYVPIREGPCNKPIKIIMT